MGVETPSTTEMKRRNTTASGRWSVQPIADRQTTPSSLSGTTVAVAPKRLERAGADRVLGNTATWQRKKMVPMAAAEVWSSSWKKTLKKGRERPMDRPRNALMLVNVASSFQGTLTGASGLGVGSCSGAGPGLRDLRSWTRKAGKIETSVRDAPSSRAYRKGSG